MTYERKTTYILISDELRDILKNISNQSIIAQKLLRKRHLIEDVVENHVNFISVSTEDLTKISYLSQDRMQLIDPSEFWESSRRYKGKPGTFVQKLFKNISQRDIELFSNLYISQTKKPEFTLSVVKGDDIKTFYHYQSYNSCEDGSLGQSCMKHDGCSKFFDLYTTNSDIISMLIMKNNKGNLIGRALLWNDNKGVKVMDRIYTSNDEFLQFFFKKWAEENGYIYKSVQNWSDSLNFTDIHGLKNEVKITIDLGVTDLEYYPYMDTFKFLGSDGKLHNHQPDGEYSILCSSEGRTYDYDYLRFDSISRIYRYSGESIWIPDLNIWTHESNLNWSLIHDKYILSSESKWRDEVQDYLYIDESRNDTAKIEKRILEMNKPDKDCYKSRFSQENRWITSQTTDRTLIGLSDITQELQLTNNEHNDEY